MKHKHWQSGEHTPSSSSNSTLIWLYLSSTLPNARGRISPGYFAFTVMLYGVTCCNAWHAFMHGLRHRACMWLLASFDLVVDRDFLRSVFAALLLYLVLQLTLVRCFFLPEQWVVSLTATAFSCGKPLQFILHYAAIIPLSARHLCCEFYRILAFTDCTTLCKQCA